MRKLKFKKLHPDARLPEQKSGDVGWDVFTCEPVLLDDKSITPIGLGIALADDPPIVRTTHTHGLDKSHHDHFDLKYKTFIKIEGRSGNALYKGIFPVGGIVDPSYRGEIIVLMYNSGGRQMISAGSKIAQLIVYPALTVANMEAEFVAESSETLRGDKGFGSTG